MKKQAHLQLGDLAVVSELGRRLATHRMARNLTQSEFADQAGVARSTVQRIEGGASIQLSSFVKLLRALDRLDGLDAVLTPEVRSPLADLERQRAVRQRVRHPRGGSGDATVSEGGAWTWGDPGGEGDT